MIPTAGLPDLSEFNPDKGTNDSGGSGGSTTPEVQASDDYMLRDAIGSGTLGISVDSDSGRATETISGMAGTTTKHSASADDQQVASVDASSSNAIVEMAEQAIEKATGGRAFGTTEAIEDIGSGEAVVSHAEGSSAANSDENVTPGGGGGLGSKALLAAGVVAAGAAAMFLGGGS